MSKYDDASWHYGGDFPDNLDYENGATHIGMFLTWCIDNNLISEFQLEEAGTDIEKVRNRIIVGSEFLISNCDEKFTDEDLNDLGNQFASSYYEDDTEFAKAHGSYTNDYQLAFEKLYKENGIELESFYHIENNWDSYEVIRVVIDERFKEWKIFIKEK